MKKFQQLVFGLSLSFLGLSGCRFNSFDQEVIPDMKKTGTREYPLSYALKDGMSGLFVIEKHSDGTVLAELQVKGMDSGKRYFGKISKSNASDASAVSDIADLGEIDPVTGICKSWVKLNYQNNQILFDSLIQANAMVRVVEVQLNTNNNKASEVLRGDIGSNVLTADSSSFLFKQLESSGVEGKLNVRQRENGVFLLTATIQGLEQSQSLPLNYYKGDYATGSFVKVAEITKYSVGTTSITFGFPWLEGDISVFDTARGFLALESDTAQPGNLVILSLCNFGGNTVSGNQKKYFLFNPTDSSLAGSLLFQEIGASGSPLRLTYQSLKPDDGLNRYLSLHVGTTLDPTDSIFVRKVSNTTPSVFQNIPDGSGGYLTFEKLQQWNVNARLVEDLSFSNLSGSADIGQNEIEPADSIVRSLSLSNPDLPSYTGTLIFRPRKNGKVLVHIRLTESYAGIENSIVIKDGPVSSDFTPYQDGLAQFKISFNGTSVGQSVKETHKLLNGNGQEATWNSLKSFTGLGNYMEHNFTDEYVYPLSRGIL